MTSGKQLLSVILIRLLLSLHLVLAASHSDVDDARSSLSLSSGKVNLSVYYEALSPSSAHFIVQNLASVFSNDLISIINLRMVPWANANISSSNNTIFCQDAPDKRQLNAFQACAISVWNDVNKYYGFIYCLELLAIEGRCQDWNSCFASLGLSEKPVSDCYNSSNGTKLESLYGNETLHLDPPLTFVPWVVVNNQPIGQDYRNFASYVCRAYNGSNVHEACESVKPKSSLVKAVTSAHPVKYRGRKAPNAA